MAQAFLEAEEQEWDGKWQQAVSWIEEAQWKFVSQLDSEHLHKRISWLCCLPFCCSFSQVYMGTNFRPTIMVGICAGRIQAQQGTLFYVAVTLGGRIVSLELCRPAGPCGERWRSPANSAQGTSFLWPVSFPPVSWLCPCFLHPSPLSAFHLSLIFLHRCQDTNVLLSLCLWNKLGSLEAAIKDLGHVWYQGKDLQDN